MKRRSQLLGTTTMLTRPEHERFDQLTDAGHARLRTLDGHPAQTARSTRLDQQTTPTFSERARQVWLRGVDAHRRAAELHQDAVSLHARRGNDVFAVAASEAAARERTAYERALARHPEWTEDAIARRDGRPPIPAQWGARQPMNEIAAAAELAQ